MDESENLLRETILKLQRNGLAPEDVRFVSNADGWFTWHEFAAIADIEYDNGISRRGQEIDASLRVVGDGWCLERNEYDGGEWWEYKKLPAKPKAHAIPKTLKQ